MSNAECSMKKPTQEEAGDGILRMELKCRGKERQGMVQSAAKCNEVSEGCRLHLFFGGSCIILIQPRNFVRRSCFASAERA